jgi:hypothetical protein
MRTESLDPGVIDQLVARPLSRRGFLQGAAGAALVPAALGRLALPASARAATAPRAWLTAPPATGCMWGAFGAGADSALGRHVVTTHSQPAPFNPDGWSAKAVIDMLNGGGTSPYAYPVDVIIHMLGIRKSDPTFPPGGLADVVRWTPYVQTQVDKWVAILRQFPRPVLGRMWHEMNDGGNVYSVDTNPGNSQANYVAAWRRIHDYLIAQGVKSKVQMVWCQGGHLARPSAATAWFPGTAYVDWIATDAYSTRSNRYPDFTTGLAPWYKAFSGMGRPMMLAEMGSDITDPNRIKKVNTFLSMLSATYPGIKSVTWWNHSAYAIADTPKGYLSAYRAWVTNPYMNPSVS